MKRSIFFGALAGAASAVTYTAYRRDLRSATLRTLTLRRTIESPYGPIEFGESGVGQPVLVVHGAGGGFDQGLDLADSFLGDGFHIVAPSRFGYLGSALPPDASPEAQADAFVRILDALSIDRVPAIGVSAGGPSTMQFCLRHPDRCSSLVLIVPLAYAPVEHPEPRMSPFLAAVMNTMLSSDFLFWTSTRVAHDAMVEMILGTPAWLYRSAKPIDRRKVDEMLKNILPVSRRAAGLANEMAVAATLKRYPLERVHVPTLVISAEDDGYRTYDGALYTAEHTHGTFVGYATGGHLLLGHEHEVRSQVTSFVRPQRVVQPEVERDLEPVLA
jgi:pimeloyl-ACP methyl ester carboxylesterase